MATIKKLGIWMCHSNIHLVEYNLELSEDLHKKQVETAHNIEVSNALIQNEAYHLQTESFKKLGIAIEKYEEVLLFGPVDAKMELLRFLHADGRFNTIKIEIKQTPIMSEEQQQVFVEKHFST